MRSCFSLDYLRIVLVMNIQILLLPWRCLSQFWILL